MATFEQAVKALKAGYAVGLIDVTDSPWASFQGAEILDEYGNAPAIKPKYFGRNDWDIFYVTWNQDWCEGFTVGAEMTPDEVAAVIGEDKPDVTKSLYNALVFATNVLRCVPLTNNHSKNRVIKAWKVSKEALALAEKAGLGK